MKLTLNQILTINVVIFSLVALLHLLRVFLGWDLVIGRWLAPHLLSIILMIVAAYMAYNNNLHRS